MRLCSKWNAHKCRGAWNELKISSRSLRKVCGVFHCEEYCAATDSGARVAHFVAHRGAQLPVAVVVAPVGKVLRTVRAPERPFPSVDALVSLKRARHLFLLPTVLTHPGFGPYLPNVLVREGLAAVPAGMQALAQVNVAVLPHVVHRGVVLSAPEMRSCQILKLY